MRARRLPTIAAVGLFLPACACSPVPVPPAAAPYDVRAALYDCQFDAARNTDGYAAELSLTFILDNRGTEPVVLNYPDGLDFNKIRSPFTAGDATSAEPIVYVIAPGAVLKVQNTYHLTRPLSIQREKLSDRNILAEKVDVDLMLSDVTSLRNLQVRWSPLTLQYGTYQDDKLVDKPDIEGCYTIHRVYFSDGPLADGGAVARPKDWELEDGRIDQ